MTSELALKLTIVLGVSFALLHVTRNTMVENIDYDESIMIAINRRHALKNPWLVFVHVMDRLTMFAAIASALATAVLRLMGV